MRVDKFVKAKLFLEKAKESEANVIIDRKTVVAISDYINQIEAVNEYLQVKCFSDKDQMTAMAIRCEIQERVRANMRIRELEAEVQRLKGIINKDVLLVRPRSGKTEIVKQMILLRAKEIKSEAIKEFVEEVEKLKYPNAHELRGFVIYGEDFDNLVKEKLGEG